MTTVYYIFAAIVLIVVVVYLNKDKMLKNFKFSKLEAATKEEETILEPVLARIYDRTTRKIYNKMIDGIIQTKIIKEYPEIGLGRQWNRDGKWMYALCREFENYYVPIENFLEKGRENPPTKLHSYLVQPEVAIMKDSKEDREFMEKYGHYLPYVLAVLFLIFIMVMQ